MKKEETKSDVATYGCWIIERGDASIDSIATAADRTTRYSNVTNISQIMRRLEYSKCCCNNVACRKYKYLTTI